MKIKITIECDNKAFGNDKCDKASELNRIFNVLIFKLIHFGFRDRKIFDIKGNFVGLMEVLENK